MTTDSNRREQRSPVAASDHGAFGARLEYGVGENAHDTARRHLAEGRLTIRQASRTNGVVTHVRGDSGRTCNCIARNQCAPLTALKLITDEHE